MKINSYISAIASMALVTGFLVGCGDDQLTADAPVENGPTLPADRIISAGNATKNVVFQGLLTPLTVATQSALQATVSVSINDAVEPIGYSTILKSGFTDNGERYGLTKDINATALKLGDGSDYICNGTNSGVGSGLDFVSILERNNKLFMVSQFECAIGSMYVNELEHNTVTGALTLKAGTLKYIDQASHHGGFVHCAGQVTPWQSHLGSEEYETDAKVVERDRNVTTGLLAGDTYFNELEKYFGNATAISPYFYGWTPEVTIESNDTATYTKHYSMGRLSHELSYVMPDNKTVFMSDDGSNVGLFMYIADTATDLSAGTVYALKWNQVSAEYAGRANVEWINLGHATDAEVKVAVDANVVFSDLFYVEDYNTTTGSCPTAGFTAVNTSAGLECLKLNTTTYTERIISRLETRRYAALKGATTEFRKEEGITFDPNHNKLYVAMSEVARGMEDNAKNGVANTKYDIGSNNDIKVAYNKCGAIYALDLGINSAVGSNYVPTNMYAILTGTPMTYAAGSAYEGNSCDVDGISNPDNVTYLSDSNTLAIGEDTSNHKNNVVWAYDVETRKLARMVTMPLAAESTSPFWYRDLNGTTKDYATVVTQHPSNDTNESEVGVVGPFNGL